MDATVLFTATPQLTALKIQHLTVVYRLNNVASLHGWLPYRRIFFLFRMPKLKVTSRLKRYGRTPLDGPTGRNKISLTLGWRAVYKVGNWKRNRGSLRTGAFFVRRSSYRRREQRCQKGSLERPRQILQRLPPCRDAVLIIKARRVSNPARLSDHFLVVMQLFDDYFKYCTVSPLSRDFVEEAKIAVV